MNNNWTITIKKRSQPGWLVWILVLLPFCFELLIETLGLPWGIRYILDFAWFWLLLLIGLNHRQKGKPGTTMLALWVLLFLIYTVLVYVVEYQSALYYLWGVRNNFRFFVAFFAFAAFLEPEDISDYFKLFDFIFWINFALSLYQYFVLGIKGDFLGGVFSTVAGGNGYTNVFFAVVLTKDILFYLEKKEKIGTCVCKCLAALSVAALAELKFFFVEFSAIVVLASLFAKFTWRKFWISIGAVVVFCLGMTFLSAVFPESAENFTVNWFYKAASTNKGYTYSGDLNRLNAIPQINEYWLTNFWQRLFGLGLGNCDTSSFAIVNTPFYEAYRHLHYTWLSYAFMYLETGWIGLIFYYGFFVLVFLEAYKIEKRSAGITKTYCRMSRILAILCMIIAIYNSSLRTEAGYMMFFSMAVPFALDRAHKEGLRFPE